MTRQMVPGVVFTMGAEGKKYLVPGLTVKQLKTHKDVITSIIDAEKKAETEGDSTIYNVLDVGTIVIHAALQRNYPEMTLEETEDLVDMHVFRRMLGSIMGASGFKVVSSVEEGSGAGETSAGSKT